MSRHIISFPIEGQRFNFRVAGLFLVDGHVLICDEDDDGYCMLPGGRIELGEDSRTSLAREIEEEIGLPAEVGELILTSESFYAREGEQFHELGFFYLCRFVDAHTPGFGAPTGTTPWRVTHDEGSEHRFHWLPVDGPELASMDLKPTWLRDLLRSLPDRLTHIVHDERTPSG